MSLSEAPLLGTPSLKESDKICYEPSTESNDGESPDYLIFFLPGNPGLIQYYQPFLSRLHDLLSTSSATESSRFHICGHSHNGFEIAQDGRKSKSPGSPLGLEEQIQDQERRLYSHIESHRKRTGRNPRVILMGHSVGCYMLLELIQHHRDKIRQLMEQHCDKIGQAEEDFDLIGGILLFPTITHIAKSPLGMVFGVRTFDPLPSLRLNLSEPENPTDSVFTSNCWTYREYLIVVDSGKRSLSACQAGNPVP